MAEKPMDRRGFFRQGFRRLLGEAAGMAENLGAPLAEVLNLADPARPVSLQLLQRPPGAIREVDYLNKCTRCGDCVKVCPAHAIVSDPAVGGGAPFINSDTQPCVMCNTLACMSACPTGALTIVPRFEIDMGTAVWAEDLCLLSSQQHCDACVVACPMGSAAIEQMGTNDSREVRVHPLACTGCGLCQNVCPTTPKAIRVIPKAARER